MKWLQTPDKAHLHRAFVGIDSVTWCGLTVELPRFTDKPKRPCLACEDAMYRARGER